MSTLHFVENLGYTAPAPAKKAGVWIGVQNHSGTGRNDSRKSCGLVFSCPFMAARWEGRKTRWFSSAVASTPILSGCRPQLALGVAAVFNTAWSTPCPNSAQSPWQQRQQPRLSNSPLRKTNPKSAICASPSHACSPCQTAASARTSHAATSAFGWCCPAPTPAPPLKWVTATRSNTPKALCRSTGITPQSTPQTKSLRLNQGVAA